MAQVTLKGSPTPLFGELPKIGAQAPNFELVDQDLKRRYLSDFKGKRKIISIVPSLDTPTCSLSTKKFNQEASKLSNTVILVVSADLPFAQKRFCGAEGLENVIPLSLMNSKKFAEDYGVLVKEGPLAGLCTRAIVCLDENDTVVYIELVSEITHEPNYEKVLKIFLRSG